jgi:uncharacterized Zn finger protein
MAYPTKIATCCHCGTRATLRVDRDRHALTCANCGAPLTDIKMLPKAKSKAAVSHQRPKRSFDKPGQADSYKKHKPRNRKSRSKWFRNIAGEVFDLVEDIFD